MVIREANHRTKIKNQNRGLVLQLIATGVCRTKAELATVTGLSKMGINKIVNELIDQNLLEETDYIDLHESGRRPIALDIAKSSPKIIGIMIERGSCSLIVTDLKLHIYLNLEKTMPSAMSEKLLLEMVYTLVDQAVKKYPDVIAIGLASIGPVNPQAGTILKPYYFYDIHDVPIVKLLEARYKLPVFFNHDNQSAILAEFIYGIARKKHDAIYIGVGVGVGCGLIVNGQIYSNHRNLPPEFGHVSVKRSGRFCRCGNKGCIETYIRTPEILSDLSSKLGREVALDELQSLSKIERVDKYFESVMSKLTIAIVNYTNILNCELVILGRDALSWPSKSIQFLSEEVNRLRFAKWDKKIKIAPSSFGRETPLIGAACNVLSAIFNGYLVFEDVN